MRNSLLALLVGVGVSCGGASGSGTTPDGGSGGNSGSGGGVSGSGGAGAIVMRPAPACTVVAPADSWPMAPALKLGLRAGSDEGWLGSPAVADLDRDGVNEVIAARGGSIVVWKPDGSVKAMVRVCAGRIWASPVVADFVGDAKLEVAAACRGVVGLYDAGLQTAPGFPVTWRDEMRALAAGDVDGDGKLELVAGTTSDLESGGHTDIFTVFRADGSMQRGFPPNTTGTAGCDTACYTHAGFDQNVAVGPLDDTPGDDIVVPQDNAYISVHRGSGVAFDAAPIFRNRRKVLGVRFLHDYAEAQQGYSDREATALQAHFTNSPAAIADLDGDGTSEIVMVASVQNAAQTMRQLGAALWVVNRDGTRPAAWTTPFHVSAYLAGLSDLGNNIVAVTQQPAIADLDASVPGPDIVFPGFDGKIHLVGADKRERWAYSYTTDANVLTGGVAIADLSGDGVPEIVFASYAKVAGKGALHVLDAHGIGVGYQPLPGRGAMAVPTIADVDGDGTLEIVVSLKDADAQSGAVLVFTVPKSAPNCMPWPTGRGNLLRNGAVGR